MSVTLNADLERLLAALDEAAELPPVECLTLLWHVGATIDFDHALKVWWLVGCRNSLDRSWARLTDATAG